MEPVSADVEGVEPHNISKERIAALLVIFTIDSPLYEGLEEKNY
jgi:hypothetical protein